MVSLGPNYNMSSGASFLADNPQNMEDDRQNLCDPVLSADSNNRFQPLKTIPVFSLHNAISLFISFIGIILAATWEDGKRCQAYFIMLYLRAFFWVITFIFHHYVHGHHNKLRLNGHLEFYKTLEVHRSMPLTIVSLWNTAVLTIQTLIQQYYGNHFGEECIRGWLSPIVYITSFSILESTVLSFVHINYISKVANFNKTAPLPDALRGSRPGAGYVGLMQPGADVTELLEKQADVISYLKDHNIKLNQKLMQLNAQMRTANMPQNNV
ncbi:unnamed protein product [Hermetia illucens]|uniref:Transmembrane protein 192 n=1 Tax=Hermetia illucens TaxID=343691 RepID=A0A7R8V5P3_HERIL|nr:transmembrane protein 192 [Hermetia illucens]CAD7092587.1 unnamed protein product [Hermetia illucens]